MFHFTDDTHIVITSHVGWLWLAIFILFVMVIASHNTKKELQKELEASNHKNCEGVETLFLLEGFAPEVNPQSYNFPPEKFLFLSRVRSDHILSGRSFKRKAIVCMNSNTSDRYLRIAEGSWKYVEGDHNKVVIANQVYTFVPSNPHGEEM